MGPDYCSQLVRRRTLAVIVGFAACLTLLLSQGGCSVVRTDDGRRTVAETEAATSSLVYRQLSELIVELEALGVSVDNHEAVEVGAPLAYYVL